MKRKPYREKTNPRGETCEPHLARFSALVDFRCLVRDCLARRSPSLLADIERLLGSFAPSYVRGDYVPTIAQAYAEAIDIINQQTLGGHAQGIAPAPRFAGYSSSPAREARRSRAEDLDVQSFSTWFQRHSRRGHLATFPAATKRKPQIKVRMLKTFTLTLQYDDRTRFLEPFRAVADSIAAGATEAVRLCTTGPVPLVSVTEEQPARITAEQHNAFPGGRW